MTKKEYYKDWYKKNKERNDTYTRQWKLNERLRLIEEFGGMCTACGERDSIVLDFDHINNDGYLDKRKTKGTDIIFSVKREPERFQLLCKNCNWRKEYWRRKDAVKNKETS